jgi:stringent starvation protein B
MGTPADKQSSLNGLVQKGVVMLHLDARRPGVRVPDYLKNQEWLRLNFNHAKGRADLVVNDWGVRETLRFNGAWFPVSVPWSAVFAMSQPDQTDQPTIFPEDLPEEMVEAALARLQREGYSLEELEMNRPQALWSEKRKARASHAPAQPAPSEAEATPPAEPTPGVRRGHLRLVK